MAGGFITKSTSTQKQKHSLVSNTEKLLEAQPQSVQNTPSKKTYGLSGILGLNQSIDIHQSKKEAWGKEFLVGFNHLVKEEQQLLDSRQKEIQKSIQELREEIKKLIKSGHKLDREVEKATLQPIVEATEYQLKFLDRLKNLIISFQKSISEASNWLEAFQGKKKKRNAFWNKVKSKKGGGEQYLNSGEHSVSRSVA